MIKGDAKRIAKQQGPRISAADLAHVGLMKAMISFHRYDPDLGYRCSTYFRLHLINQMRDVAINRERVVPLPRGAHNPNYSNGNEAIKQTIQRARKYASSLDMPTFDGEGDSLGAMVADHHERESVDEASILEIQAEVRYYVNRLHPRYRQIIELRMEGLTMEKIGERLEISRERVRQLEDRGLKKLHRMMQHRKGALT